LSFSLRKINSRHIVALGLFFGLLNGIFILTENFWGLAIPLVLSFIAFIIFALDRALLFLIFSTPLSIFYLHPQLHLGFTIPTEPLIFGIMLLFFAKVLYHGHFDRKVVRHPVSILLLVSLAWMLISAVSSELPLISFKYFAVRLWFVSVFFFLLSQMFKHPRRIEQFIWLYLIPLCGVVVYTTVHHGQYGFTQEASGWVMTPFFPEHTSYGAVIALYFPVAFALAFLLKFDINLRVVAIVLFAILSVGLVLSYTRAAWVSLVCALVAMLMIVFQLRRWAFVSLIILFFATLYYFRADLIERFEDNDAVSSDNLTEHVESISNISSDASNMERINRWKAAYRMWRERPVLGFGPGTYMFLYAPFQKPYDKTIISTNAGDLGNAHSEYIGPLAEQGLPGSIIMLLLVFFILHTGIRVYHRLHDSRLRILALMLLMGLITYFVHGLLNNFLDLDKAACPVFGFSAVLVVLDCYYLPQSASKKEVPTAPSKRL